jgi:hypothetical protein
MTTFSFWLWLKTLAQGYGFGFFLILLVVHSVGFSWARGAARAAARAEVLAKSAWWAWLANVEGNTVEIDIAAWWELRGCSLGWA